MESPLNSQLIVTIKLIAVAIVATLLVLAAF